MYDGIIKKIGVLNLYAIVDNYIMKNESHIVGLARKRMLKGDGVNGGIIGEYASLGYSYFKQAKNPLAGGYVDLYLTGSLQKAMELKKYADGYYIIHSTDIKYFSLAEKYGEEQFGLTDEQMKEVKEFAIEEVINKIYKSYE